MKRESLLPPLLSAAVVVLAVGCGETVGPTGGTGGTAGMGGTAGTGGTGGTALCAAVDCSDLDDPCNIGACDPATGACEVVALADLTACNDGHACTSNDACASGQCEGDVICAEIIGITTTPSFSQSETDLVGNVNGGFAFEDSCPADQVLIGVRGELFSDEPFIGRIRAVCGRLEVTGGGLDPYSVTVLSGANLPLRGARGGGASFRAVCPENQMVVGFGGRAASLVDQLVLRCAPLEIMELPDEFVGFMGTVTELAPVGGNGGIPFKAMDCGNTRQVGTIAHIRAADFVDAFGIGCQEPDLVQLR